MNLQRRTFLWNLFAGSIACISIGRLLISCAKNNGGGGTTTTGGNCDANGTSISIQVVHTPNHTLTILAADVVAGADKTYTLADNGSGHTHQVTITAADFTSLQGNTGILETSTVNGHTHTVTVNCA